LVLARGDGITADPVGVVERLATLLQRLDGARTNDRPGGAGATDARSTDTAHGSNPLPPTPPLAIEQRIRTWCRHRHAELQLLAPTGQRSASHRRLVHALDALPKRAPRARRARVAAAAAEARRLALALHGAGAEQLFDQLTHRRPHEGCPSSCDAAGAATRASARARTSTRPASPPDASCASATTPAVTRERDALEEPRLDERWLDEHWLDGVLAALRAASPAASSTPPGGVATHAPGRGVATAPPLPLDDPAPCAPSALVRLDAMLTLLPPATAQGSG
jgi:hypothetical protein